LKLQKSDLGNAKRSSIEVFSDSATAGIAALLSDKAIKNLPRIKREFELVSRTADEQ
jgi:hypothetical protein